MNISKVKYFFPRAKQIFSQWKHQPVDELLRLVVSFWGIVGPAEGVFALGKVALRNRFYRIAMACAHYALANTTVTTTTFLAPEPARRYKKTPVVSVIVPTYNRAASLARCLESICIQDFPGELFEVVVVNNACTDTTAEVCDAYSRKIQNLHVALEPVPGLLAGRHAGWRAASADILTFCDDDIEAFPHWLETIHTVFLERPDVYLVGGNCQGAYESDLPEWFSGLWEDWNGIRLNRYYSLLEGITVPCEAAPDMVFGCNFSARRLLLEKALGTGPDCMEYMLFQGGGENLVCDAAARHELKAFLHPAASVFHHMSANRLRLDYMRRRGVYAGVGMSYSMLRDKFFPSFPLALPQPKNGNAGLGAALEGINSGFLSHLEAALVCPELREWIMRPSYYGNEAPPEEALRYCSQLSQRLGW